MITARTFYRMRLCTSKLHFILVSRSPFRRYWAPGRRAFFDTFSTGCTEGGWRPPNCGIAVMLHSFAGICMADSAATGWPGWRWRGLQFADRRFFVCRSSPQHSLNPAPTGPNLNRFPLYPVCLSGLFDTAIPPIYNRFKHKKTGNWRVDVVFNFRFPVSSHLAAVKTRYML